MASSLPDSHRHQEPLLQFRYQVRVGFMVLVILLAIALVMTYRADPHDILTHVAILVCMLLTGMLMLLHQWRIARLLRDRVTEKESYLSSVLASSIDAIIFLDTDDKIVSWNNGAELMFGYDAEEMVGNTFHPLIPPGIDADDELKRIREVVESVGFIRNYRAQRITKAGKRITVDVSRTMILSDKNRSMGNTVIIRDITDKEEMDKQIYNTEKLASLGTLAAGVAHEINNPLAVILGFSDLLREKFEPGSPVHDDLKIIEENANNAKRIVESMLGFARITEGLEDNIDVRRCIERVVDIVKVTLKKDDVSMVIDVPEQLPMVRGDVREFQQVLFNLINNSMAAMVEGGGVLTLQAESSEQEVAVSVSDTGPGIPKAIQGQILDPFFTTKKVGEGTGLGLSLCYGIVKKYGGNIEFNSTCEADYPERPTGTTFTVLMPALKKGKYQQGET